MRLGSKERGEQPYDNMTAWKKSALKEPNLGSFRLESVSANKNGTITGLIQHSMTQ